MLLNAVLRSEFDPVIQSRGADYFRGGRIRSSIGNDVAVIARVSASRDYTVNVGRVGDEVELSCTCHYFEGDGTCKHLWAVLLFAEAEGFLRGDGRPRATRGSSTRAGRTYEYLDGQTRDRAARVVRFQSDPACPLFLVSLKTGGLGLNLTAAGYVFILDPWWNPAVEAQAVDRAHRIGQSHAVFAYRLITKDTIEERVAELQQSKKQLANSILTADAGLLQTLQREDLELLLS